MICPKHRPSSGVDRSSMVCCILPPACLVVGIDVNRCNPISLRFCSRGERWWNLSLTAIESIFAFVVYGYTCSCLSWFVHVYICSDHLGLKFFFSLDFCTDTLAVQPGMSNRWHGTGRRFWSAEITAGSTSCLMSTFSPVSCLGNIQYLEILHCTHPGLRRCVVSLLVVVGVVS